MRKGRKSELFSPQDKLIFLVENTKEYVIIVLDTKGKVEDWNKGAEHLLGYTQREIVGKNFSRFFTPEDRKAKRPENELKKAIQEGKGEDENWLVRQDGSWFWASGMTTPILDKVGNVIGFAKIVRDLTDKREIQQQQEDFISIASHELRTPLTIAKLLRDALGKHLKQTKDIEGIAYFEKISHALNQLDTLLRDLLSVGRMQTGKVDYEKEEFSLWDLTQDIVEEVQQTTNSHHIEIHGTKSARIYAYKPQISEVIINLLTNAIKYSPNEKKIIVTVSSAKKFVTVSIQDFGIGIAHQSIEKLFDRFYRTPLSREKGVPGVGLGLYISKKIIENHKGTLGVKSTVGKGSTFSFTLPFLSKRISSL